MCVTNFYRWITIKAVASDLQTSNFFISQVDFHFLSPDFIMILKGQSMFSASVDESFLQPLYLIICSCYHGIRDLRIPHGFG